MDSRDKKYFEKIESDCRSFLESTALSEESKYRYRMSENNRNLAHYRHLTKYLIRHFDIDSHFAMAAYLHGLIVPDLYNKESLYVANEVFDILKERRQLRSLDLNRDLVEKLQYDRLPAIKDNRSAFLYVIEQLLHIDPDGRFLGWAQEFRTKPCALPEKAKPGFFNISGDEEQQATHCQMMATISEYCGLWMIRNAYLNASVYFLDKKAFRHIIEFCSQPSTEAKLSNMLKSTTEPGLKIAWEWHNIAKIYGLIPTTHYSDMTSRISVPILVKMGQVIVICKHEKSCYSTLYTLHSRHQHIREKLYDFIGNPKKNGYKALHTTLLDAISETSPLSIKIIPSNTREDRYALFRKHYLVQNGVPKLPVDERKIIVFDSKGTRFSVRTDCTIDEFYTKVDGIKFKRGTIETINKSCIQPEQKLCEYDIIDIISPKGTDSKIHIFTPALDVRLIPENGTVLDFAGAVHSDMVSRINGTIFKVNGLKRNDIFYRLQKGDTVEFAKKKLETIGLLPKNWRQNVPKPSHIYKKYIKGSRAYVRKCGKQWLSNQLKQHKIICSPESHSLNSFLEDIIDSLISLNIPQLQRVESETKWWFRQLGLYHLNETVGKTLAIPGKIQLNSESVFHFIQCLKKVKNSFHFQWKTSHSIPNSIKDKIKDYKYCNRCRPSNEGETVGIIKNDVLVLHDAGASCVRGENVFDIVHRNKEIEPKYIVIEANNEHGVTQEILTFFDSVNLKEIIATQAGFGTAIIRVMFDHISDRRWKKLEIELQNVPNILQILGPNEPVSAVLERHLPSRCSIAIHPIAVSPFICGPEIHRDDCFYGMEPELLELLTCFNDSMKHDAVTGQLATISAPTRVGKTSLALAFLRKLEDQYGKNFISCYISFPENEPYLDCISSIDLEIADKTRHISQLLGLNCPFLPKCKLCKKTDFNCPNIQNLSTFGLLKCLHHITEREKLPFVLVLDEFNHFAESADRETKSEVLAKLIEQLRLTPKFTTVLIGPNVNFALMHDSIMDRLAKSQEISVRPFKNSILVENMITALKSRINYDITVDGYVIKKIIEDTGGNPLWINLLGKELMAESQGINDTDMKYNVKLYNSAFTRVVRSRSKDFRPRELEGHRYAKRIVSLLASENCMGKKLSSQELSSILDDEIELRSLEKCLFFLVDVGFVKLTEARRGDTFSLSPRILREHCRLKYSFVR